MARGSGSSAAPSFAARPAPRVTPVKTYTDPMSGRQMLPNGTLANPITKAEAQVAWKRAI